MSESQLDSTKPTKSHDIGDRENENFMGVEVDEENENDEMMEVDEMQMVHLAATNQL